MTRGMTRQARQAAILLAGAFVLAIAFLTFKSQAMSAGDVLRAEADGTVRIGAEARARGLTYAPGISPGDRAWIEAAIAQVRPEAAALIAEVDGLVTVGPLASGSAGGAIGLASGGPGGFTIDLDLARLDNDLAMERNAAVVHELGHIVDFALVGDELLDPAERGHPAGRRVRPRHQLRQPGGAVRDTFAKWALRGAFSIGSGYGVPMPASIEGWGQPLGALALTLPK